jgi:hypothetical protein
LWKQNLSNYWRWDLFSSPYYFGSWQTTRFGKQNLPNCWRWSYNGYICVFKFFLVFCKCFKRILQVFQMFRTYVTGVSSECCKSRSGIAQVAMHVRSGGDTSGPFMRSSGAGPVWAYEMQACTEACWPEHKKRERGLPDGLLATSTAEFFLIQTH